MNVSQASGYTGLFLGQPAKHFAPTRETNFGKYHTTIDLYQKCIHLVDPPTDSQPLYFSVSK